jgi:PKD repeat protein
MKKIYLIFSIILINIGLFAQTSGGPDAYGYTWKNSNHTVSPPTYSWLDITTIGEPVTGLADDNVAGPFTTSNGFQFYWYPTPQFWIGSNGYITFNGDNIASPFPTSIPLATGANNWISPMLADLNFTGAGNTAQCYLYSNPDTLCVSFLNVPFWYNSAVGYSGSCTFQIILNKVDKSITFNYMSINLGLGTLDNAVGIENNSGSLGLQTLIDVMPSSLSTIKYYYPTTVTYAVTDGGVAWNDNEKNAGIFIKKGKSLAMKSNVKNFGNQVLSNFKAKYKVLNSSSQIMATDSVIVTTLPAASNSTIQFTNQFTPITTGQYKFETTVSGIVGDMVASNNSILQEINVIDTTLTTMILDYSDGLADGSGLGWNGGGGGIAIYVKPPVYPCKVVNSRFMITANDATNPYGFYAKIYDDDGADGKAKTLLDSVYVPPSNFILNSYVTVPTTNQNLIVDSGGVYLYWEMGGPNINIARDITPPISRRTFEVLGAGWAEYRDKMTEDFLMGIGIQYTKTFSNFIFDTVATPVVNFTDKTLGAPNSWAWDFDDNGATSALQNPTHNFTTLGNHNVCLITANAVGSDTTCKNVFITSYLPVASFSYSLLAMPVVSFYDLSTHTPTSWHWDFDDSGNDSSNLQNPIYQFKNDGLHNVCLIATNNFGSSASYCVNIQATGTGINEYSLNNSISIFPNPSSGNIVINGFKGTVNYIVYNLLGELITSGQLTETQNSINLVGQSAGVYHIVISSAEGNAIRKIVIE